jgi:monovalent cation:H+ antiporter-2, CPA2 family
VPHHLNMIVALAIALGAALVFGYVTARLHLSPIVGYLLAGIALSKNTPGPVANMDAAAQFAEIGVVLLMFGVGLHFKLKDLVAVRSIAIPGAVGQSLVATALGTLLAVSMGWTFASGVVIGIGISVASTVVLVRGLEDQGTLESPAGRVAVGWLVVEDLFTIVVLVVLPAIATATSESAGGAVLQNAAFAVAKVTVLAAVVLGGGGRAIPWLLSKVARTKSRELFTLTVLAVALAVATLSATVFGASLALGAFLAGMVVGQSPVSHQAAADALPLRDAFAVLFFVSVGMLFDPSLFVTNPGMVVGILATILVAKPLAALAIVSLLGHSAHTALTVAVGLAQIGEFSFILADVARDHGLLPAEGHGLLVTGAVLSIAVNPLLFRGIAPFEAWLRGRPRLWAFLNRRAEARGKALSARVADVPAEGARAVVVGYGPVGRTLTRILREFSIEPVIVDLNVDTVASLAGEGRLAVYGDAAREEVLRAAGIEKATYLLVTLPDLASRLPVILAAREMNPGLKVFVRAHYIEERAVLAELGATRVAFEEAEAAVRLARFLLEEVGAGEDRIRAEAESIRGQIATRRGPK